MTNGFLLPQKKKSTLEGVGLALGGFGAGFQGKGGQFLAQQQAQQQQLSDERKRAAAEDVFRVKQMLDRGDLSSIKGLAEQRFNAINQVGGDPTETQSLLGLTNAALAGDQNAFTRLKTDINEDLQAAVRGGFIQLPTAPAPQSPEGKREADIRAGLLAKDFVSPEKLVKEEEVKFKAEKLKFDQQNTLTKEALKEKRIDNFIQVQSSMDRLLAANEDPTGASDVSMIFSFMKMLDPGSVVRESEFQLASDTAGAPQFVKAAANKLISGERLTDVSRGNFVIEANKIFKRSETTADKALKPFLNRAKRFNLNPDNLRNSVFGVPEEAAQVQTEDLTTLSLEELIARREALGNE